MVQMLNLHQKTSGSGNASRNLNIRRLFEFDRFRLVKKVLVSTDHFSVHVDLTSTLSYRKWRQERPLCVDFCLLLTEVTVRTGVSSRSAGFYFLKQTKSTHEIDRFQDFRGHVGDSH